MKVLSLNFLLFILVLFNPINYAEAARVNPEILPSIEAKGSVRVLVSLVVEFNFEPEENDRQTRSFKVPDQPVELTRSEKLQRIRSAIAPVQQEVLDALNALPVGSFTLDYQYEYLASLDLEINLEAFELLRNHEKVLAIQLDLEGEANLKGAKAIMKVTNNATDNVRQFTQTGKDVTVAVFDTGIDTDHLDFNDSAIVAQKCFVSGGNKCQGNATSDSAEDDAGHGSHVSGIITSPEGIAPDAKIVAVKVINNSKSFSLSDLKKGIDWLVSSYIKNSDVDIINMSLGLITKFSDQQVCNATVPDVTTIFNQFANELNIVSFAASGNDSLTDKIDWPACLSDVIAVGNSDDDDSLYSSGNRGVLLDIVAPGETIMSTEKDGDHKEDTGTSMSSPMAAGVAALLLQKNANLAPHAIRQILIDTGDTPTNTAPYPRINAEKALGFLDDSTPILLVKNGKQPIFEGNKLLFSVPKNETFELPLELNNIGMGTLEISEPSFSSGSKYSLSSDIAGSINIGAKITTNLQLDTSTVAKYDEEITIATNNTNQNSYKFNITTCVTDFPFIENFSSNTQPDCWLVLDQLTEKSDQTWIFSNNNAHIEYDTFGRDDWLITPAIKLAGEGSVLKFKAEAVDGPATFEVRISKTDNNPDSFSGISHPDGNDTNNPVQTLSSTDSDYSYDLTGYANQTVYLAIVAQGDEDGDLIIDDFEVTDETAPNFTNSTPTISDINETSFNLNVRLNEASTVYYVVSTADSQPDLEKIKTNQDGSGTTTNVKASGNFEVTTFNADTVKNVNDLDDDITYYVYVAAENAAGLATTIQNGSITTPLDTPPKFINGYPKLAQIRDVDADLSLRIDEIGDVYYVVLADGAAQPTASDIKTNGDKKTFTTANTEQTVTLNSLIASTAYDIYLVAEDKRNNLTADAHIQKLEFTTRAPFLTLNLAQNTVAENAGSMNATVTRSAGGGTSGNLEVKLVNNAPSQINMPPKVTILDGETSVSFNIQIKNNGTYTGSRTVQIGATEDTYEQAAASFEITEDDVLQENSVFTQPPPEPDYVIVFIGSPNGRVVSEPEGIDCDRGEGSCWHIFPRINPKTNKITQLILHTTAPEGLYFDGWAGDSDCNDGKLYLNDSKGCLAYFYGIPNYQNSNTVAYLSDIRFNTFVDAANSTLSQFNLTDKQSLLITASANDGQIDPALRLEQDNVLIAQNDSWLQARNRIALEELIPLSTDASTAALLTYLETGSYSLAMSAMQSGFANLTIQSQGVGLSQISTRLWLTENNTVSFTLQDVFNTQAVLIKVWGTTLDLDPTITLISNGNLLDSNDNWQQGQRASDIPQDKQPNSPTDAALLVDLSRGNYELHLSTANNINGLVVVEIQLLDN